MVNRSMQAKILKKKRRGRYAVFSGGQSKYAVRIETGRLDRDGKTLEIPVGPISLSNQVPKGKGPDAERMATYYERLRRFTEKVPPTKLPSLFMSEVFKEWEKSYNEILQETKEMRICLVDNHLGRVDLFFKSGGDNEWFFVDIDYKKRTFRRSRIYGRKSVALDRWKNNRVTWVEHISPSP